MITKLRAIDLYSGVGGWSLGLRLAGIDVVASYERWGPANETNFKNNAHQAQIVDIRRLSFDDLPDDIDIVVGSPPCTQFSFSNRGGNGDLDDGLEDIIRFLTIVDHLRPKAWAMENVPRVAPIIEKELKEGGRLHQFCHLGLQPHVISMEGYGIPQRRRRCIAGNFNHRLLESYAAGSARRSLGEVVAALAAEPVVDPLYGLTLPRADVTDHDVEQLLNTEEIRINRAAKANHPVYNSMQFPDPPGRAVRTITATCTRVSRESIIIADSNLAGGYRRLTVRERACLQGFPITFQFYGANYGQKLRMVGNAIPPAFAFLVAHAFKGTAVEELPPLCNAARGLTRPMPMPAVTIPDRPGTRYPPNRTFRFAITSLQLKSGVRFELANRIRSDHVTWGVSFWFGSSKSIQTVELDFELHRRALEVLPDAVTEKLEPALQRLAKFVGQADVANMQTLWSHHGPGKTRPFMLLDELIEVGELVKDVLAVDEEGAAKALARVIDLHFGDGGSELTGIGKLLRNAPLILAGLLVGSLANTHLRKPDPKMLPARTTK